MPMYTAETLLPKLLQDLLDTWVYYMSTTFTNKFGISRFEDTMPPHLLKNHWRLLVNSLCNSADSLQPNGLKNKKTIQMLV